MLLWFGYERVHQKACIQKVSLTVGDLLKDDRIVRVLIS